jgi:hypothetical protein
MAAPNDGRLVHGKRGTEVIMSVSHPGIRVETPEAAVKQVELLCARLVQLRNTAGVNIEGDPDATEKIQVNAHQHWLMTYGQTIGVLAAFRECGLLGRSAYRALRKKAVVSFQGDAMNIPLMRPGKKRSADELLSHIESLCHAVVHYRDKCASADQSVRAQKESYITWNLYYGRAIGALIAYRQANCIGDVIYDVLRAKIQDTLASRVVGSVA